MQEIISPPQINAQPQPIRVVREIPASMSITQNLFNNNSDNKIRLAAYARVSSDKDEQINSFNTQKDYYSKEYTNKPNIQFVGLYADEAISGKHAHNRPDFQRLMQDCKDGKIDRIVTKSVSRFARNQVDCMRLARDLKNKGITILFETQGIDTKDEGAFVILSILASLAEEEIRTLSRNTTWGKRKRYKEGKLSWGGRMFGYDVKDEVFTTIPEEALIVREIFELYLNGKSFYYIARHLESKDIKTIYGKDKWQIPHLEHMLKNEKYCGDVITQKTFAPDIMLSRRDNLGQLPKYEIQSNHIGIVTKETFDAVQTEMLRRRTNKLSTTGNKSKHASMYPFSGKLICPCGSKHRRFAQTFKKSLAHSPEPLDCATDCHPTTQPNSQFERQKQIVWVCIQHQKDSTTCKAKPIKEDIIEQAFVRAINTIVANKEMFKAKLDNIIEQAVKTNEQASAENLEKANTHATHKQNLESQLEKCQQELIRLSQSSTNSNSTDKQVQADKLINKIQSLQSELELHSSMNIADNADNDFQSINTIRLTEMKN